MPNASLRWLVRALVLFAVPAAQASGQQPDTVTLAPVQVTANRLPVAPTAVTAAVTVLAGADLRARGIQTVADALRTVPGVAVVETGSYGGQTSLFVRGGESNYVKVLLDGVPLNQPGGAFDFADLTTADVERIEIVRGPVSVLYGSDAVAGVVQIFTRRGAGPAEGLLRLRAGGAGSLIADATASGSGPWGSYAFTASRWRTEGTYPFNNGYRDETLSGSVRLVPDARTDATLTVRRGDAEFHYPTNGAGQTTDHNQFRRTEVSTVGLELGRYLSRRLEGRVAVGVNAPDGTLENQPDSPSDSNLYRNLEALRRSVGAAWANLHLANATVLTAGVEVEAQRLRSFNECASSFGSCTTPPIDERRTNRGYFAQIVAEPAAAVAINAGVRLEDNQVHGRYGTFRVGAAYRLPGNARLRASVGTGFKEPTFPETFGGGYVIGNPALKPERSRSWELGVERGLAQGRVMVSATYFDQRFRNLVDFTFAPAPPDTANYYNVAAATADGLEFGLHVNPGAGVQVEGTYTWLHSRVDDPGLDPGSGAEFAAGTSLLRRPAHSANVAVGLDLRHVARLHVAAHYAGTRADQDFSTYPFPRVTLPAFTTVDVTAGRDLWRAGPGGRPAVALHFRVQNLFDARYETVKNFPGRRRTAFLGADVRFGT